jgi:hypothetical protein
LSSPAAHHRRASAADNRETFDALLEEASHAIERSRFRSAAVTLQTAARFAWFNHPGAFQSTKMGALTAQIGDHLPKAHQHGPDFTGHVVHVLSQAYAAGGHTRLVWRWIENDATRLNSVVLTGQQGVPVPQQLADAVAASGGHLMSLGETSSSLLVRAADLRRVAESGADTIVLHVHPYDVLPSIALINVPATVIFLNHADHVFSVGAEIADIVADIRPAGQQLSVAERNRTKSLSTILPIPLAAPSHTDKRVARESLGLAQDAVVALSIASGYKYGASAGNHFIDIHRDLVLANPALVLLVVGPESDGRWQEVSDETGGRFRAVGMVKGLDEYYGAADLYVDSIPFASLTSLLDAAVRGVPVLALNESVANSVLTSNDPSLMSEGVHYSDRHEYIRAFETLATQPEERRRRGEATRASVIRDHLSPGWNSHLERVLEGPAASVAGGPTPALHPALPPLVLSTLEEALVDFQIASGLAEPLWASRLRDAPYMPVGDRVRTLMSTPAGQRLRAMKFMVPDALRSRVKIRLAAIAQHRRDR